MKAFTLILTNKGKRVIINGFPVKLVVDTGASRTVLESQYQSTYLLVESNMKRQRRVNKYWKSIMKSPKSSKSIECCSVAISLKNKIVNVLDLANV